MTQSMKTFNALTVILGLMVVFAVLPTWPYSKEYILREEARVMGVTVAPQDTASTLIEKMTAAVSSPVPVLMAQDDCQDWERIYNYWSDRYNTLDWMCWSLGWDGACEEADYAMRRMGNAGNALNQMQCPGWE